MGSNRLKYSVVCCFSLSELKICKITNSPGKVNTSIVTFLQSEYIRKVTKSTNKNLQIMVKYKGNTYDLYHCFVVVGIVMYVSFPSMAIEVNDKDL